MNIPENYFLYISIGIGILMLALIIIGYLKGFLYELVAIVYTAIAIFASWFIAPILANLYPIISVAKLYPEYAALVNVVNLDAIINTIAYFVIVFLVLKLFYFVLTLLLKSFNKIPVLGKVNQILGGFAGLFNGLLICMALSTLLSLPVFKNGNEIKNGTILKYTNTLNKYVINYVVNNVDFSFVQQSFEGFDVDSARVALKALLLENE